MVESMIPLPDQIKCVAREIALRRNVYPGFVRRGKMKQEQADREIAVMEAVLETVKAFAALPPDLQRAIGCPDVQRGLASVSGDG